jgi:hypothetical protein
MRWSSEAGLATSLNADGDTGQRGSATWQSWGDHPPWTMWPYGQLQFKTTKNINLLDSKHDCFKGESAHHNFYQHKTIFRKADIQPCRIQTSNTRFPCSSGTRPCSNPMAKADVIGSFTEIRGRRSIHASEHTQLQAQGRTSTQTAWRQNWLPLLECHHCCRNGSVSHYSAWRSCCEYWSKTVMTQDLRAQQT